MKRLTLALGLLAVVGCVQKPTRVGENVDRPFARLVNRAGQKVILTENTRVLDARGAFDHGLNHVNKSTLFTWDQLAQSRDDGEVSRDPRRAAERLALIGVTPQTPVVVVGDAPGGDGGDGRLAWALVQLGVTDVQMTNFESLRAHWSPERSPAPVNAPAWSPTPAKDLEISAEEFKNLATSLADMHAKRIWLVDVRTPREYLKKFSMAGTVNLPWNEFYSAQGRPSAMVRRKLSTLGIDSGDRIILLSPRGVRAGAAAFALLSLGFPSVQILRM